MATLTRNKSRSLLTAFGVFWGIFMLVTLMGGGNGFQNNMKENFEGFATNSCFLASNPTSESYKGFLKGRWWTLQVSDMGAIKNNVEGVDVITATICRWGKQAICGERKTNCSVKGLFPDFTAVEAQSITYGRFINEVDIRDRRKVCVLGKRVYEGLFDKGVDPCGTIIKVDGINYRIIGVSEATSNINIQGNAAEQVMLPYSVFQSAYNIGNDLDVINMTVKPGYSVADVKPEIEELIKQIHYIAPTDKQAIFFLDAESMFTMVDNLFIGIRFLILLVGAGTLLAGIIGVSNIMMVTVRERTTEIGIRRAIGAQPRDILTQIMAESVVLTIVAGMVGICAGVGVLSCLDSTVVSENGGSYGFQVSFGGALGMLAVIVALGLVAGLAPAYRAMSIKPVDAMRDE